MKLRIHFDEVFCAELKYEVKIGEKERKRDSNLLK